MPLSFNFQGVTLLITHYNRSTSLERLLISFRELQCTFEDIVISDDHSNSDHLEYIQKLQTQFNFRLITADRNRGLANNINKGQDEIRTPYTLYIQEDFIPNSSFPESFQKALDIMDERADLDIVRFYSYVPYPYKKEYKYGYSEMIFKAFGLDYLKVYSYSDHPHLRRSDFLNKFGRYNEKIPSDRAEYKMCLSFIQNKGKGLLFDDYKSLLKQYNPNDEPSTVKRYSWTTSKNPIISSIRFVYRQLKYNYDIQFTNSKQEGIS